MYVGAEEVDYYNSDHMFREGETVSLNRRRLRVAELLKVCRNQDVLAPSFKPILTRLYYLRTMSETCVTRFKNDSKIKCESSCVIIIYLYYVLTCVVQRKCPLPVYRHALYTALVLLEEGTHLWYYIDGIFALLLTFLSAAAHLMTFNLPSPIVFVFVLSIASNQAT